MLTIRARYGIVLFFDVFHLEDYWTAVRRYATEYTRALILLFKYGSVGPYMWDFRLSASSTRLTIQMPFVSAPEVFP